MAPPVNIDAAHAVELAPLPNTIVQNVNDAGTTYTVWYKYTRQVGDFIIGVWGFGDLTIYQPAITVFKSDGTTVLQSFTSITNVPFQFDATQDTVFFFKVVSSTGNVATASLNISALKAPAQSTPNGSILINDDSIGYPACILDASTGSVLKFINVVTGELGASLSSGMFMLNDQNTGGKVDIYNIDFSHVISVNLGGSIDVITSDRSNFFFVIGHSGAVKSIYKIDTAGTIVQTLVLSVTANVWAACVTLDGSTLYYSLVTGNAALSTIRNYNLLTNTDIGVVVAANAPYFVTQDMLMLADSTIIAGHRKAFVMDYYVQRYNAVGTVLNTYPFGEVHSVGNLDYRICLTTDDPDSFWTKTFRNLVIPNVLAVATFERIKVSNGSTLAIFDVDSFESGIFVPDASPIPSRFGPSESCPMLTVSPITTPDLSGIYFMNGDTNPATAPTHDIYNTANLKIPDPTIRTALIGE